MRSIFASVIFVLLLLTGIHGSAFAQSDDSGDPGTDAFNNGDYVGAMNAWKPRADQNDPEAMNNIGNLYNLGLGVKKDIKQAATWYERAAQLGFVVSQYNLANLYYSGNGISRDLKQAARWYQAAAQGGHAKSMLYLAQMYETGEGVNADAATATQWYQKASNTELPEGEYEFGRKLIAGDGIEQNKQKGSDLVLQAAEAGFGKAQYQMADYYWRGKVVPKNVIEAYVWASQAVATIRVGRDRERVQSLLENIKSGMTGQEIKAAEIELKAVLPKKKDDEKNAPSGESGEDPQ